MKITLQEIDQLSDQLKAAVSTAERCLNNAAPMLPEFTIRLQTEHTGADGAFSFQSDGTSIVIRGDDEGLRCGLYTLLKELRIYWFHPAEEIILPATPVHTDLSRLNGRHTPDFSYRGLHICAGKYHYDERVAAWMSFNRMNRKLTHLPEDNVIGKHLQRLGLRPDTTVHAYDLLIRDSKYFAEHPDYFALVGGRRIRQSEGGQLCLSNKEMRKAFASELLALIRQKPHIGVFGFCPNDGYGHCECADCKALDTENDRKKGTVNGRVADFVNEICFKIGKAAPSVMLGHYSYSNFADFMELLPEPPKNLLISFTQFHCYSHSIADGVCKNNRQLNQRFRHIRSKVKNVYIYDYYTYRWGSLPAPVWEAQCKDFRYWKSCGVNGFMSEVSGADSESWNSFWPAFYLAARLLWNADEKPELVFRDICQARYGKASEIMRQYFEAFQQEMNSWGGCFTKNPQDFADLFTPSLRKRCNALLEAARQLEPQNSLLKKECRLFQSWCDNADARRRYLSDMEITAVKMNAGNFAPQKIYLVNESSQQPDLANDTKTEVAASPSHIRFRVKMMESKMADLKIPPAGSDAGKVYNSDNLELFLADGTDPEKCYHFIIASNNHFAASECKGTRWNWAWKHDVQLKTERHSDHWMIELMIPKNDIHTTGDFSFSIIRNRYAGGKWQILGAPGGGAFFKQENYIRVTASSEK